MNANRIILAMCLLVLAGGSALADEVFDQLLFRAVRYGNTEEKRQQKEEARKEFLSGGATSLRGVMDWIHTDNVGIHVLAQELVDQMKSAEAVPVLLDFVKSERWETRKMAVYFLGSYAASGRVGVIRPLLADEKVRGVTIRTLGKWGVTNATLEIAPFLTDENERIRVAAANALRDIGDPRAIPFLIAALGDEVFTVRNTAQRALVSFGKPAAKPLLQALETAHDPARRQIIRALGEMKVRSAYRPLSKLRSDPDPGVSNDVRQSLRQIPGGFLNWPL